MRIRDIRMRRNCKALHLVTSAGPALWAKRYSSAAAFAFCLGSIVSLVALIKCLVLLYDARLIVDNPVLTVCPAHVYQKDQKQCGGAETIVVSTFGILAGEKAYLWGRKPGGCRLMAAKLEGHVLSLVFGDGKSTMRADVLHGLKGQEEVAGVREKLWRETGVKLTVRDG